MYTATNSLDVRDCAGNAPLLQDKHGRETVQFSHHHRIAHRRLPEDSLSHRARVTTSSGDHRPILPDEYAGIDDTGGTWRLACGHDEDDADEEVTQTGLRLRAIAYTSYFPICDLNVYWLHLELAWNVIQLVNEGPGLGISHGVL